MNDSDAEFEPPASRKDQLVQIGIGFSMMAAEGNGTFDIAGYEPGKSNWREIIAAHLPHGEEYGEAYFCRPGDEARTRYMLVTGPGTFMDFDSNKNGRAASLERPMALSPLVVMVGPDAAVPWSQPGDLVVDPENPRAGLGDPGEKIYFLAVDGSVQRVPANLDDDVLLAFLQSTREMPPDVAERFERSVPDPGFSAPSVNVPE